MRCAAGRGAAPVCRRSNNEPQRHAEACSGKQEATCIALGRCGSQACCRLAWLLACSALLISQPTRRSTHPPAAPTWHSKHSPALLSRSQVFDAMFRLCADSESSVQSAVQFLDNLVKDIVTASNHFNVDAFIPKLRDYLRVINPHKRQFLISWITGGWQGRCLLWTCQLEAPSAARMPLQLHPCQPGSACCYL